MKTPLPKNRNPIARVVRQRGVAIIPDKREEAEMDELNEAFQDFLNELADLPPLHEE